MGIRSWRSRLAKIRLLTRAVPCSSLGAAAAETRRVCDFKTLIHLRCFCIVSNWLSGVWWHLGDVVDDLFLDHSVSGSKLGQFFGISQVRLIED